MTTISEVMEIVQQMAKDGEGICYLYKSFGEYRVSFNYWVDWIFKADQDGNTVLSERGKQLVEAEAELTP